MKKLAYAVLYRLYYLCSYPYYLKMKLQNQTEHHLNLVHLFFVSIAATSQLRIHCIYTRLLSSRFRKVRQ